MNFPKRVVWCNKGEKTVGDYSASQTQRVQSRICGSKRLRSRRKNCTHPQLLKAGCVLCFRDILFHYWRFLSCLQTWRFSIYWMYTLSWRNWNQLDSSWQERVRCYTFKEQPFDILQHRTK